VLDAFLENDIKLGIADDSLVNTRLGCETLTTTNKIVIAGEGRGQAPLFHKHGDKAVVDREMITEIARGVVKDIGYDQDGFSYYGADVEVLLHGQSPDIAMGVDAKKKKGAEEEGAGDQGMMFGYACTESEVYEKGSFMPAPIYFAHKILKTLADKRRAGQLYDLQPDAKSQVTVKYVGGKPVGCTKVVVSTQHNAQSRNGKKYTPGLIKDMIGDSQPRKPAAAKPAIAAKPTAKPVADPAPAKPAVASAGVEAAITRWAQAWSARDVDAYLAAYARDFAASGMTRADWEAQRRARITAPKSIEVKISDLKIEQQEDSASATFRQTYRSDRLSSTSTKTLKLALQNGEWRIVGETSR